VDKLEIYRRLGVLEVWLWQNNKLNLYRKREDTPSKFLDTKGYELVDASELLPELNIPLLEECTLISDDILAIDEFEQGI
jgi:Uma2 family endonuclease